MDNTGNIDIFSAIVKVKMLRNVMESGQSDQDSSPIMFRVSGVVCEYLGTVRYVVVEELEFLLHDYNDSF